MTDDTQGKAEVAEFGRFLTTLTPRLWLVPAIVAANVLVFGLMVASGVDAFSPAVERVLAWGANFGPLTFGGQPWRMLASVFLHFGAIHLLMNMVALWDAGRMVERIFGQARFGAIYAAAGLGGSLTSMLVHPQIVSAGASGAVFGVYGALGGFLLRQRGAIPPKVLSNLSRIAVGFLGYNLLYGFARPGIDVAAHLGGALAGALAGAYLARPLAPGRPSPLRGVAIVAALCVAALAVTHLLGPAPAKLVNRRLPGFSIDVPDWELVSEKRDYTDGKLMLKNEARGRAVFATWWTPGPASRAHLDEVPAAAGFEGEHRIVTYPGPGGRVVDTLEADSSLHTIRASVLDCGGREIGLLTMGAVGIDALHRRILPTLVCTPDPRLEPAVGAAPPETEE